MKDDLQKAARMAAEEIMKAMDDCREERLSCCEDREEEESSQDKAILGIRADLYQIMKNFREKNDAQALINLGRLSAVVDRLVE